MQNEQIKTTRVSIHAISRLNERMFNNYHLSGLSEEEKKISQDFIIKILDETHPNHNNISDGTFVFKDYNINMLKINDVIVTVRTMKKEKDSNFDFIRHQETKKTNRKDLHERKEYIGGKYRVRDGFGRKRGKEF